MASEIIAQALQRLTMAIRESEEYTTYASLKESVMGHEMNRALLQEYQRVQAQLQVEAMAGKEADGDEVQRFSQLSSLLYTNPEVAQYLLAQLRLQKLTGEIVQKMMEAAGLEINLPGM